MNINDKVKAFGITQAINYLEKDPESEYPKVDGNGRPFYV